jgi:acyl-CoA thioesterase YciA
MTEPLDPTLRVTMLPRDTNSHGTIFGGVILSHIDLAGGIAASRQASRNFVTRAMREVEFIAPVYVGDVVSFYTSVVRQGTTSITVKVSVEAWQGAPPSRQGYRSRGHLCRCRRGGTTDSGKLNGLPSKQHRAIALPADRRHLNEAARLSPSISLISAAATAAPRENFVDVQLISLDPR